MPLRGRCTRRRSSATSTRSARADGDRRPQGPAQHAVGRRRRWASSCPNALRGLLDEAAAVRPAARARRSPARLLVEALTEVGEHAESVGRDVVPRAAEPVRGLPGQHPRRRGVGRRGGRLPRRRRHRRHVPHVDRGGRHRAQSIRAGRRPRSGTSSSATATGSSRAPVTTTGPRRSTRSTASATTAGWRWSAA